MISIPINVYFFLPDLLYHFLSSPTKLSTIVIKDVLKNENKCLLLALLISLTLFGFVRMEPDLMTNSLNSCCN